MARELQIIVTAETQSAVSSLNKTEDAIKGVTAAAGKADDSLKVMEKASQTAGKSTDGLNAATGALTATLLRFVSAAAIGAAIDRSIEFGSAVTDLSVKTGLSTDALQSLGFVAEQTGSTMESMARAVTFLDKTLEAGGNKTVTVLRGMGLSVEGLLALSPEDRFREVALAIGAMTSSSEQAYAATVLFGRGGAELIPMFRQLAMGAEDASVVMSSEVVSALDEAGDAMNYITTAGRSMLGVFVAVGVETGKVLAEPFLLVRDLLSDVNAEMVDLSGRLPKISAPSINLGGLPSVEVEDFDKVSKALDKQRNETEKAAKAAERLAEAQRKAYEASIVWGSGIDAAINYTETLTREIDALHMRSEKKLSDILDFEKLPYDKAVEDLVRFQSSVKFFSSESSKAWGVFAKTVQQESPKMEKSFSGLSGAVQNLPQTIIGALQGGGSALKSIGASLGSGLASDLASNLGSKLPGLFGGALSAAAGPLGSIVGSLAGSLVGKLFGPSQQQQVTELRNKFLDASGGLAAMQERADAAGISMTNLFNAKRPQDFEAAVKAFNQQLAESEKRTADTRAAMEKWGITLDQMGPKFAMQEINGKLLAIVKDMELLTAAGADFNLVAEKMAPEINKLIAATIKAGGEIPREMEPILRKMFDLGLLTDANGNKLEEFGDIPFATNLNQQFATLINKMDQLLSRFFGMEDSLSRSKETAGNIVDIVQDIQPPSWMVDGGPLGFDRGGVVGRDFRMPSMRDTVPALLRPGEVVLTPEQAANRGSSAGGTVNVSINVAGYLDSVAARQQLASIVSSELGRELRQRRRVA